MRNVLATIFGRWQAPAWMHWCKSHPSTVLLYVLTAMVFSGLIWAGRYWYINLPQPQTLSFQIIEPAVTDYHQETPQISPLTLNFSGSVAPLEQIGQPVSAGISLSPTIAGQWRWASDRHLQFMPDNDWPVDKSYHINIDKKRILADHILLAKYKGEFTTAPFTATIDQVRLYQDPSQPDIHKLVATLAFSHPVDTRSVKSRLSIQLSPGLAYRQAADIELTFDNKRLFAYLHSAPLDLPLEPGSATLEIDKGISAAVGGKSTEKDNGQVQIPGRYQLQFNQAQIHFVDDSEDNPGPVLTIESSRAVSDEALKGKVNAWLLPETNPNGEDNWHTHQVSEGVLKQSDALLLTAIAGAEGLNTLHSFQLNAPVGRYIAVKVDNQVEGKGGYLSREASISVLRMPDYPKTLSFLGDGALLMLDGEQRLGYVVRGISGVQVEVAQLLPSQINQLIDQSSGRFARPYMDNISFDRIVTRTQFEQHHPIQDPAKNYYGHVSLNAFLQDKRGIFVVKLTPTDTQNQYTFDYSERDDHDLRFVVVTDLGIVAKRNRDGSQDVFVQSLSAGQPIENAHVSVIGRNGLAVATTMTDAEGHANFDNLGELRREKMPLFYQVEKDGDLSFLPINNWSHQLDLSRFNVGGTYESDDAGALSAYLFTDRGLYRPGETTHITSLVRGQDWTTQLNGLPVKLEVIDPRGIKVLDHTFNLDSSGFDSLDFTSSETAAAGNYMATLSLIQDKFRQIQLGNVSFTVRDFEPDRIKVRIDLAEHTTQGWLKPEQVTAAIAAEQLFGGAASDRRVTAEMVLNPIDIRFSQWDDYHFGLTGELKETFNEMLAEAQTDADGQAILELALNRFDQSTYSLHLLAKVYETGSGHHVSAQRETLVSSADTLIGYKSDGDLNFINKDSLRRLHLIAVDQNLTPQPTTVKVEHIARRWVSVLIKQDDGSYRYESRRKNELLGSRDLLLTATGLDIELDSSEPGDYQLRIVDSSGQQVNLIDYSIAGQGNTSRSLDRHAELALELDKSEYAPGENIAIAIQAPYTGAGLITIERDKVYAFKWFKADTTRSVQHITLPDELEGNAYVNVQFLRSPDSEEIFMSPLSYAVTPFNIALGERRQQLSLELPAQVKPGEKLDIQLYVPKPAKVLVFGVDAGILQVARYSAPDPLAYFFAKKALTVDSSQILDLLLPELRLLMRHAASGGDMSADLLAANLNPFKRKRAEPIVYWSGLQQLAAGDQHFHYTVPDSFNGKIRFFAVSVTDDSMGTSEAEVSVKAPIVMTANVPALLAPGDEAEITLGLYNTETTPVELTLQLDADKGLQLLEQPSQPFTVEPAREATARFRIKASSTLGEAKLRWLLELNNEQYQITEYISVRPLTPFRQTLTTAILNSGEQTVAVDRQLFEPFSKLQAGLQNSPLVWVQGLENYLQHYPHTCTEQLVSKAVPALILGQSQNNQAELDRLISQLRNRQNSEGGFGLWAANPIVDPMVTLYVIDMLLDARANDYSVPQDMLDNANSYLSRLSSGGSNGLAELRERAYAAYLLARQEVRVGGALADIQERLQRYYPDKWQADMAAAWLAASFTLTQNQQLATPLWDAQPWQLVQTTPQRQGLYLDPLVHDAQLLTLIARHAPERLNNLPNNLLPSMGKWLSQQRYSSLSAATLVRALSAYTEKAQTGDLNLSVQLTDSWQQLALPLSDLPFASQQIRVQKTGKADAFYMLSQQGFDVTPIAPYSNGLEISRDYLDLEGNPIHQVTVGDEFLVRLRLRTTELDALEQVVLIDLLPGGVEPVYREADDSFDGWQPPVGVGDLSDWSPEWINVREDRLVLYGTASRNASTFVYKARATNSGQFQIPPVYAEGLYDPLQQSQGASGEFLINTP